MTSSNGQPRNAATLAVTVLFLFSTALPWAWFNVQPKEYPTSLRFQTQSMISGFDFIPEEISAEAIEILSTTNLVNGSFLRGNRERYTVFAGEWDGKTAKEMSVIQHTPDICWVGGGAKPADLGQPETVEVEIAGEKILFECRIFRMSPGLPLEMTIWCALASGQVVTEGGRFSGEYADEWDRKQKEVYFSRIRAMNMFAQAVSHRLRSTGSKQFVRLSTSVEGDWRLTLLKLKEFAPKWLTPQITTAKLIK